MPLRGAKNQKLNAKQPAIKGEASLRRPAEAASLELRPSAYLGASPQPPKDKNSRKAVARVRRPRSRGSWIESRPVLPPPPKNRILGHSPAPGPPPMAKCLWPWAPGSGYTYFGENKYNSGSLPGLAGLVPDLQELELDFRIFPVLEVLQA